MPAKRSYAHHGDACAGAHGIEVIGEVWTYPIVREMFLGPKRFGELAVLVRGITPGVLTTRLRELTARGLVRQVTLPPPARGKAYELTPWGQALEPVIEGVSRWAHASPGWRADGGLTPDAVVLAMKTMTAGGLEPSIAVQLDLADQRLDAPETYSYRLDWDADGIHVVRGTHPAPDALLRIDSSTLARVLFAGQPLDPETVSGDAEAVRRLLGQFSPVSP